jgi:hypothetical protein
MLSVRYFKKKDPRNPVVLPKTQQNPSHILLDSSKKLIYTLLIPSLNPAQKMKDCREAFHTHIQTSSDASERSSILSIMKTSLRECFQLMNIDDALQESQKTIAWLTEYDANTLLTYTWLATSPYANALSTSIISELSEFFNEACWEFFDSLYKQKNVKSYHILQNILTSTLNYSAAHLNLTIVYFALLDHVSLTPTIGLTYLENEIHTSAKKAEKKIKAFYKQLTHYAINCDEMIFHLDRILFFSYVTQAKLALKQDKFDLTRELMENASLFIKKHSSHEHYPNCFEPKPAELLADLKASIEKKIEAKKNETKAKTITKSTTKALIKNKTIEITQSKPEDKAEDSTENKTSPCPENKVTLNHKLREAERKRLKKREKETSETTFLPKCYETNLALKNLLDQMCEIFKDLPIEGYLFGSANYKQNPGDFDVLLPNIKTDADKEHVMQLIQIFEAQGGIASRDNITGELGYRTGNRYVIPVTWKNWMIDFIISEQDFIQHAKTLDFTIGAMYFSLRDKKMFYMKQCSPFEDLHNKIIRTIGDTHTRFQNDPSLIFRGIRLCATENFYFSYECIYAISHAFFEESNNLFMRLKRGKLYQQLNLILTSDSEQAMWNIFYNLNLFYKLWDCLLTLPPGSGEQYISRLQNHLCLRLPEVPPPYQPGFFMAAAPLDQANHQNDAPALNTPSYI